jgi:hypothetical protein
MTDHRMPTADFAVFDPAVSTDRSGCEITRISHPCSENLVRRTAHSREPFAGEKHAASPVTATTRPHPRSVTATSPGLAGKAQRAFDSGTPGYYIVGRETGHAVRGPFREWHEANLALSHGWPVLNRREHEVVER